MSSDLAASVQHWIASNWSPDVTVRDWWQRLFDAGYTYPAWPVGLGGLGLAVGAGRIVHGVLAANKVIGPPRGYVAAGLAAPTILEHGTPEQIAEFVPAIARGEAAWCQLFSEPGSGSDLASVGARAVSDGDEWVVSGQKVWNSGADHAQFGMLLARTDVDQPKHAGLTYFLIDMDQPGIETRPLRQMDGGASFCEVFLTEARIPAGRVLGEIGAGWRVANTTLYHERSSIAGGGFAGLAEARSGPIDGDIDLTCGEIVERARRAARSGSKISSGAIRTSLMIDLARQHGAAAHPVARQALARYYSNVKVNGWLNQRIAAARGRMTGADGSLSKMTTSRICQESRDLSWSILGADAMLAGSDGVLGGDIVRVGLASPGTRIGGGTDEIQLNVIGERALGLPREPSDDKDLPYRDLKVGTQR